MCRSCCKLWNICIDEANAEVVDQAEDAEVNRDLLSPALRRGLFITDIYCALLTFYLLLSGKKIHLIIQFALTTDFKTIGIILPAIAFPLFDRTRIFYDFYDFRRS